MFSREVFYENLKYGITIKCIILMKKNNMKQWEIQCTNAVIHFTKNPVCKLSLTIFSYIFYIYYN